MHPRTLVLLGIVFGTLAGVFALGVQLVAIFIVRGPSVSTALVGSVLEFLIIGSAGRRAGASTRRAAAGIGLGALAGGVSELIHSLGSGLALVLLPVDRAAIATLSLPAQAQAADPTVLSGYLLFRVLLLTGFGALFGWLGAWSALRFGAED